MASSVNTLQRMKKDDLVEQVRNLQDELEKQKKEDRKANLKAVSSETKIKTADSLSEEVVISKFADFRNFIAKTFTSMEENFLSELRSFKEVREATKLQDDELKEVHEITRSVGTLDALAQTYAENVSKLEAEMAEQRAAWKKEKEAHAELMATIREDSKDVEKRRQEEWAYDFERRKKLEKDAWEDELSSLRKQFNDDCEAIKAQLQEQLEDIEEREAKVSELESKVEQFSEVLEEEVAKAVVDAERRKDSHYNIKISKESAVSEQRIALLEQENGTLKAKIDEFKELYLEAQKRANEAERRAVEVATSAISAKQNISLNIPTDKSGK